MTTVCVNASQKFALSEVMLKSFDGSVRAPYPVLPLGDRVTACAMKIIILCHVVALTQANVLSQELHQKLTQVFSQF